MTVYAIYQNGVFKPQQPVDLPEQTRVVFEPHVVETLNTSDQGLDGIYEVLSHRYDGGDPHVSQNHDEHHP